MRYKQIAGNSSAEKIVLGVRSAESSASIPAGSPVCLNMNATNDGLAVILPSNSAAKTHALFFGVAVDAISAGSTGEVTVFGFVKTMKILLGTRAASTDSWTSTQSHAAFCMLNVDTVNNAFSSSGGTLAVTAFLPYAILGETLAVVTASASATSDSRTALTTTAKGFLRAM